MTITEKTFDNYRIRVEYDDFAESPREYADCKLCIREHRRYDFPNELDFNFDMYDDGDLTQLEEIEKDYDLYWLDCYEHSGISFNLTGHGMQCPFDTAKYCGFIAVKKDIQNGRDLIKKELEDWNCWLNGECYAYYVERKHIYKDEDGNEMIDWDYVDGCGGYFDYEKCLKDGIDINLKAYGLA